MIFIIQKIIIFVFELPDVYTLNNQSLCPASCLERNPCQYTVHELTVHLHNIALSFNFMNNILPIQHDSCL